MKQLHVLGLMAAAFVAGSFIASPELRAYAANTVFSGDIVDGEVKTADLANNAVTAAKVKDGEIKAAEIATDAVGAAELQGVTKLMFAKCALTSSEAGLLVGAGEGILVECTVSGVSADDQAVANTNHAGSCFAVGQTTAFTGKVDVVMRNVCNTKQNAGTDSFISLIIYHK